MSAGPKTRHLLILSVVATMVAALLPLLAPERVAAQATGPSIRSASVIDGAILSPSATPKLFPNGPSTLFLRGRVDPGARIVQVRIEDFWSSREWHPSTNCREARVGRTCPQGAMANEPRFSRADVSSAVQNGSRSFTYRAQLPNGMYRIRVIARRSASEAPGMVTTRWFRVARAATAAAAEPQVISRSPSPATQERLEDRFQRTPIRVVTNTAATRLHWAIREDATGRFYHATADTLAQCPNRWDCRFQDSPFINRRDFTGWQSANGGRVFFDWSLPLLPGSYTMWTRGVNSSGKLGSTTAHSFTVSSPEIPNPTLEITDDDDVLEPGLVRVAGSSGDAASSAASPVMSLSIYDLDANGFVRPDGTIGTFQPFSAITGERNNWGGTLELSRGNYRVRVRSTWPDGRVLQSPPKTLQVGPCPVGGCPKAELGRVNIEIDDDRDFNLTIETDAFDEGGSGIWTLLRVSNSRWYDAEDRQFRARWVLNDLEGAGEGIGKPVTGTPRTLARGDYFVGLRLFNADGEEGDTRWVSFAVR